MILRSNSHSRIAIRTIGAAIALTLASAAGASRWTVTYLHPPGKTDSVVLATRDGQQVGITSGAVNRASIWSGSAASLVVLGTGAWSEAYGVGGGQQVGRAQVNGVVRASLWTGTTASWVNLQPSVAAESGAYGTDGTQQVGYARLGLQDHASLWTGSAASWIDLSPVGATSSMARGVSAGKQVGFAEIGGVTHASLWSGSAAS